MFPEYTVNQMKPFPGWILSKKIHDKADQLKFASLPIDYHLELNTDPKLISW